MQFENNGSRWILCREKDRGNKKSTPHLHHELQLLSPDRLVENPEYLSNDGLEQHNSQFTHNKVICYMISKKCQHK